MIISKFRSKLTLKKDISKAIKKWLAYDQIKNKIEKIRAKKIKINFHNSKYSPGQKFYFPYSIESADTIIQSGISFDTIFSLLQNNFFKGELNLYNSHEDFEIFNLEIILSFSEKVSLEESNYAKSKLSQENYFQTLKIKDWTYTEFITSASFFYLHALYSENTVRKDNNFSTLKLASGQIAILLLSPVFGNHLFQTIKKTNIFVKYPFEWFYGFTSFIETKSSRENYKIQNCKSLCSVVDNYFQGDFSGVSYYLAAFNFMIPRTLIKYCSDYCIQTRSIALLYYILKQYQNILDPRLTEDEKCLENYALSKYLYQILIRRNSF